jgi:hypothetical protein
MTIGVIVLGYTNHFKGSQTKKNKHRWENGSIFPLLKQFFGSSQVLFPRNPHENTESNNPNGHQRFCC